MRVKSTVLFQKVVLEVCLYICSSTGTWTMYTPLVCLRVCLSCSAFCTGICICTALTFKFLIFEADKICVVFCLFNNMQGMRLGSFDINKEIILVVKVRTCCEISPQSLCSNLFVPYSFLAELQGTNSFLHGWVWTDLLRTSCQHCHLGSSWTWKVSGKYICDLS